MSIVVNEITKNKILQYIDENAIEHDFTPSFFRETLYNLKNYNQLNEDLAEHILEGLYGKSRVIRDLRTPTDEFKDRFEVAFEKFDKIPKPDDWGTFKNIEFSNRDMAENLQNCFELVELDEQFDIAMDARKMAEEAINSIAYLDKNNITIPEEIKTQMGEISAKLQELLKLKVTDVVSLQEFVNSYNENAMQIWQDYLEDPNHNLIHNFTSGAIKGEFRDKYISTSLITDNAMGTYGKSGYGFIIKPKHIVAADSKDTYTINNSSNERKVTLIKKPIKLPHQVETEMMQTCKEVNGEILNSDKSSIYSEVIVDEFEIIGSYLITNGEKELNQHYTEAIKLAEERGIPFKEFDISEERTKKGLSPLTDGMKKDLCRKILYSYAFDEKYGVSETSYGNYASSFIDSHYQEFAERFLTVKEREDYTAEDIEKEFRKMILDDAIRTKDGIHIFDKESITYYQGFFLGKVTEAEFKYIVSNRYDFNNCKTLEEFKQRFAEFNGTVLQSKYFDEAQDYLNEVFEGIQYLEGKNISDEEFEQIFNSDDRSLDKIVSYIKQREVEKQETIEKSTNKQSIDRTITPEEKANIEELEKIGEGACARLYRDNDIVYKLIKQGSEGLYWTGSLEKLANVKNSSLCVLPKEVLKNSDGRYAGYTMDYVEGRKIKDVFRNLSFEEIEQALANAELGIEEISEQGVIFDDMHFNNIMWDEKQQCMRIIDTDFFKFADEMTPEEINSVNLRKFNNQIETLIGLRDGALANYLGQNQEYMQYYKDRFKRGLMGEKLSSYELISKIKEITEKDFAIEFSNLEEITQKAQERLIEIEEQEYEKQMQVAEEEKNMPFMKKIARKLASNNFLRKLPFVNKFIEKQLDLLPEANEQIQEDNLPKSKRDALIEDLSNNGEFLNLAEKNPNRIVETLRDINNNPDLSNGIDYDVIEKTNESEERI